MKGKNLAANNWHCTFGEMAECINDLLERPYGSTYDPMDRELMEQVRKKCIEKLKAESQRLENRHKDLKTDEPELKNLTTLVVTFAYASEIASMPNSFSGLSGTIKEMEKFRGENGNLD